MIRAWDASYDPALAVTVGQSVTPGASDDEYPGWIWCENASGLGGWLPEGILDAGLVLSDFNTLELTVRPGDRVVALETRLGWTRARKPDGTEGWLPSKHLEPPDK